MSIMSWESWPGIHGKRTLTLPVAAKLAEVSELGLRRKEKKHRWARPVYVTYPKSKGK